MSRSAFTRNNLALDALIACENSLIQRQVSTEPAGLGAWISPWSAAATESASPGLATLSIRLNGTDSLTDGVIASASLWPFSDNALAFVVLQHALDYAMEPEDMLAEAARCMRGHGRLVITGFRSFSAARLSGIKRARNWKSVTPQWATASSWARACRALGLADIEITRIAVGWPWLAPNDRGLSAVLTQVLPNLASVYVLSARKRGIRARPALRAIPIQTARQPALNTAGLTNRGASHD
jgi:hypothetical protein